MRPGATFSFLKGRTVRATPLAFLLVCSLRLVNPHSDRHSTGRHTPVSPLCVPITGHPTLIHRQLPVGTRRPSSTPSGCDRATTAKRSSHRIRAMAPLRVQCSNCEDAKLVSVGQHTRMRWTHGDGQTDSSQPGQCRCAGASVWRCLLECGGDRVGATRMRRRVQVASEVVLRVPGMQWARGAPVCTGSESRRSW